MITVISGTNRADSRTIKVATRFLHLLQEAGADAQLLDLKEVNPSWYAGNMYKGDDMSAELAAVQQQFIIGVQKLVFVTPEYNGSYPGVVKLFIDGISINEYPKNFKDKHIALIGVATGRAGNLRGMDHLAASINHMGGWVLPNKLPVSKVDQLLDEQGQLTDADTIAALKKLALQLIAA
ncbi:MAG: NAD(P)H-dependent oxidoreductase [Bacteroidota bacterium]